MAYAFEQQGRESAKAFAAFAAYLDLGPQRSLAAVGQKLGKSVGLMERWSRKFDWPARVQAHSAYLASIEREAIEALARDKGVDWHKVREAHKIAEWQRRTRLLALADEMIARWEAAPGRLGTLEGIARLLELASKLGRLASGMPTEQVEHTGEDGGPIRVEFEAALHKVYGLPPGAVVEAEVVDTPPALPAKTEGSV